MKTIITTFLSLTLLFFTACDCPQKAINEPAKFIGNAPVRSGPLKVKASDIKNLALKGGGVKGIAYTGALIMLDDHGILNNIEGVAGTSAGSIVAALIALKFPAQDKNNSNAITIESITEDLNLSEFKDDKDASQVVKRYGLYKGDVFLDWMETRIKESPLGLSRKATFADLKRKDGRDLHVYACNINTHRLQEFSFKTTPNIPIAEAVRASMSIPLFFSAWQFSGGQFNNNIFVDGGMMMNYPITAFDDHSGPNKATLGLYLGKKKEGPPKEVAIGQNQIGKYVLHTFTTIREAQHAHFVRQHEDVQRTIFIDDLNVADVDFDMDKATGNRLKLSGSQSTKMYLTHNELLGNN